MRVFVAGSTGAIGVPTVRALVAAGHEGQKAKRELGWFPRHPGYRQGLRATLTTHS